MGTEGGDAFRMRIGEWREQNGLNHSEDRSVCANTQGQRERGCCGEGRVLAQLTRCKAQISREGASGVFPSVGTDLLFHDCDVACFQPCGTARCFGRKAASDECFGSLLEILLHLIGNVLIAFCAVGEAAKTVDALAPQ